MAPWSPIRLACAGLETDLHCTKRHVVMYPFPTMHPPRRCSKSSAFAGLEAKSGRAGGERSRARVAGSSPRTAVDWSADGGCQYWTRQLCGWLLTDSRQPVTGQMAWACTYSTLTFARLIELIISAKAEHLHGILHSTHIPFLLCYFDPTPNTQHQVLPSQSLVEITWTPFTVVSFGSHPWHSTALLYKASSSDSRVVPFP